MAWLTCSVFCFESGWDLHVAVVKASNRDGIENQFPMLSEFICINSDIVVASYLIFALQCLLPIFDMGVGEYLGLSIVNPEGQAREYTITATPQTGTNAQIGRVDSEPWRSTGSSVE